MFSHAAHILDVPTAAVSFVHDDSPREIELANASERGELCPSLIVRPKLLSNRNEPEIAFLLARWLTLMRPEYYLTMLLSTNDLEAIVHSAIAIARPEYQVPVDLADKVQRWLPELLRRMSPGLLVQLGPVVAAINDAARELDLVGWRGASDATSYRAGLILCGDLSVASRMIAADASTIAEAHDVVARGHEPLKELLLYAISEEFFAVRRQLRSTIRA